MKQLIVAVAISLMAIQVAAQTIYSPPGFISGNTFRSFSESQQSAYVAGLMDGYFIAPQFAVSDLSTTNKLEKCTKDMDVGQITAIVKKYLRDNPAFWAKSMNWIGLSAMDAACKQIGKPIG